MNIPDECCRATSDGLVDFHALVKAAGFEERAVSDLDEARFVAPHRIARE